MEFNEQLMRQVRARVLASPRRVDMSRWAKPKFWCGTVCCIAGHTIEEYGGVVPSGKHLPGDIAGELLGISHREGIWLFYFHNTEYNDTAKSPYRDLGLRLKIYKPGSKEYAAVVVEAIDRCIERHRKGAEPSQSELDQALQGIEQATR